MPDGKRSYKDSHDRLRKMPDSRVPAELDVGSDGNNSDHDDMSTSISGDH